MDNPGRSRSETELGAFLRAMNRKRWGIAAGTATAMLVAAALFLIAPKQYEATARLAIADFHLQESVTGDSGRETFAALVSSRATYAALVSSQTIAQRIVEEQGLEQSLDMTPTDLLEELNVELLPNTALVELSIELRDPQLAVDVVTAFAEGAEEISRRVNEADRERVKGMLADQLAAADAELDRLEAEIAELQTPPDGNSPLLKRLESEFDTALAIRSDIARRLKSSEITVASQIAELILVDPPVFPEEPSGPGFLAVLGGAMFLGLILSVLVAGMAAGIETTRE